MVDNNETNYLVEVDRNEEFETTNSGYTVKDGLAVAGGAAIAGGVIYGVYKLVKKIKSKVLDAAVAAKEKETKKVEEETEKKNEETNNKEVEG